MTKPDKYVPLDGWVYLKIYTGYRTADIILTKILYPVWMMAHKSASAEKWFYIRYSDPDFHLRFRIKISGGSHGAGIIDMINKGLNPYIESGTVWKIDVCTYFPEIERYGKSTMEMAEHIFCADSSAVMEYLLATGRNDETTWLFALASVDRFLGDFGYDLSCKKEMLLGLSRSFGMEFGKNADLAKQLSVKYRGKKDVIRNYIEGDNELLDQRSRNVKNAVNDFNSFYRERKMEADRSKLVSSIIHMSMNRIFREQNRLYEMVLYDFLFRYYKSRYCQEKPA